MKTLAEKVVELRTGRNESEETFAGRIGISLERLRYIEMGKVLPNVKEIWTMVQKYDTTMAYFMEGAI